MNITRQNYEEYFLLYVDNELSIAERKAVDAFIQQYPDLQEELKALQRSILRPDRQLHFEDKEALLKNIPANPVNESNYEEYFVLYGDDELSSKEKEQVEQFVYKHPQHQVEFELILQARLVPDNSINFPDKTYLYRTEDADKVVAFRWWRVVAAAVVILFLGGASLYLMRNAGGTNAGDPGGVAVNTEKNSSSSSVDSPKNQTKDKANDVVVVRPEQKTDSNKEIESRDNDKKTDITNTHKNNGLKYVASINKENIKKDSNIINPENVLLTNTVAGNDRKKELEPKGLDAASNTSVDNVVVSMRPEINASNLIAQTEPGVREPGEDPQGIDQYVQTDNRKNKMRGLFRKVTRVFDKATSAEPNENGKSGVRIASFAVALK